MIKKTVIVKLKRKTSAPARGGKFILLHSTIKHMRVLVNKERISVIAENLEKGYCTLQMTADLQGQSFYQVEESFDEIQRLLNEMPDEPEMEGKK